MRREALYPIWIAVACIASVVSGVALWVADERAFGAAGVAAGVVHLWWGLDVAARVRGRLRRRAIVIPQLRPSVVAPPQRSSLHPLRAWWRRRG
jgi:hypothetical protein